MTTETLWFEDFESGLGDWNVQGGVWAIGVPTFGPSAHSGQNVAGTVLDNDYPSLAEARLISPSFVVPEANAEPRLKYAYWCDTEHPVDFGEVLIQVGGVWQAVGERVSGGLPHWNQRIVGLAAYAGQSVRIGFHLSSDGSIGAAGWYLDDIALEVGPMRFEPQMDFESDLLDWSVENGAWEFGEPNFGPTAYAGSKVAATRLDGDYPSDADARLVSPSFTVPPAAQNPQLRYAYWYDTQSVDYSVLQIRAGGPNSNAPWQDIDGTRLFGSGAAWAQQFVDLAPYADQTVQFAFHLVSDASIGAAGVYIDNVALETD